MFYQLLGIKLLIFITNDTRQNKSVKHMLVGDVNILLDLPRIGLAIRASIITARDDFIVRMTKYSFTFFAFFWIIKRNAVANRTCDELML
jgi:hypothetical protein